MADLMDARRIEVREITADLSEQRLFGKNLVIELRAGRVEAENFAEWSVVEAVSDLVDVGD